MAESKHLNRNTQRRKTKFQSLLVVTRESYTNLMRTNTNRFFFQNSTPGETRSREEVVREYNLRESVSWASNLDLDEFGRHWVEPHVRARKHSIPPFHYTARYTFLHLESL